MEKLKEFVSKYKLIIYIAIAFIMVLVSFIMIFSAKNRREPISKELDSSKHVNEVVKDDDISVRIKKEVLVEVGSKLPDISDYFETKNLMSKDVSFSYYYGDKEVSDSIFTFLKDDVKYVKKIGTYNVIINNDDMVYDSLLKIVDTTPPNITLKEVRILENQKYDINDFLESYSDNSLEKSYIINYKKESDGNYKKEGTYEIPIRICDNYRNCLNREVKLVIEKVPLKVVKTTTENVILKKEEIKYGVTKVTKANINYDVYNDGSKKEKSRGEEYFEINQTGFNGTVKTMLPEAQYIYANYESTRNAILQKTNEYRREANSGDLVLSKDLSLMATIRAMEMAYSGLFSHTRPDGRGWQSMWQDYKPEVNKGDSIGENLAYGFSDDLDIMGEWRKSNDHYQNMIKPKFKKIGIGKYTFSGKTYWVQLFQG